MSYNKYRNSKITIDSIKFDSLKEGARYQELQLMKKCGEIKDIELQPVFELQPKFIDKDGNKHRKVEYRADFKVINKDGSITIEDVKGYKTEIYKLKKKMLLFRYPDINFKEM